jgi:phosphopantothenoylcysteine decarboxylase / phosphopantothenate---cysteine ligase
VYRVETAQAMFDAVMTHLQSGMIFIGAAAVGDYGVDNPAAHKLKKKDFLKRTLTLSLNPDILSAVSASAKAAFVVGFAAETSNVLSYAADKLRDKSLDMLVANQVGVGLGFDVDDNQVTVLTCDESIDLEKTNKIRLAGLLIALIADRL